MTEHTHSDDDAVTDAENYHAARESDAVCLNCGHPREKTENTEICPACCDHDGEITHELVRDTCETCHTEVVETDDGFETKSDWWGSR